MDILIMVGICALAIFLRLLTFPMAPLLLGFILGGMMEDNLRRALLINDDSLSFLWQRITVLILIAPVFQKTIKRIFHIESRGDSLTID
jgi:putative tricarboxylic transport membrane protein